MVPFYQREAGPLAAALASCFAQSRQPDFLFLVDDGSPSPPEHDLARLSPAQRERVTVIRRANGGPGAARNSGLEAARVAGASLVAFLDSDDAWQPDHLERSAAQLGGAAGVTAVTANWVPSDGGEDAFAAYGLFRADLHPPLPGPWGARLFQGDLVAQQLSAPLGRLSTLVFDLERHPQVRFAPRLRHSAEDRLFFIELALAGAVLAVLPTPGCRSGHGVNIFAGVGWGDPRQLAIELDRLAVAAALERPRLSHEARRALRRFRAESAGRFWRHWLHHLRRGRWRQAELRRLSRLAPDAWYALPRTLAAILRKR